jgi:fused signal recognition particle receptor
MVVVYVFLAVAVAAAIYFLFLRPSAPNEPSLPKAEDKADKAQTPKLAAAGTAASSSAAAKADVARDVAKKEGGEKDGSEKAPLTPGAKNGPTAEETADAHGPSDASSSLRPAAAETPPGRTATESVAPPSLKHVRNVDGLRKGLQKARDKEGFFGKLLSVFSGKKEIDKDIAAEIEEVLLASDVGVKATEKLLAKVRENLQKGDLTSPDAVWSALREEALRILRVDGDVGAFALKAKPTVVLMVGVNGAGKTTTIGKLATRLKGDGHQVVLAAADTFRAAAVQQLVVWGNRVGVEVVKGKDGADPGSVIFEAVQRAKQTGADVVLADTAGRLHTKSNLMAELSKVVKTTGKALEGAPHEVLLVLDSTNGQNALAQATEFQQALPLTGVVLTKLDGTAKGGVVIGICDTLKLPVRFVGLGETANDLHDFDPEEFVEALLGREEGQA